MEKANLDKSKEFVTPYKTSIPVIFTYQTVKVKNGYVTIYPDFYNREKNRPTMIADIIRPYLKEGQKVSLKKIMNYLKTYQNQTINVPVQVFAD